MHGIDFQLEALEKNQPLKMLYPIIQGNFFTVYTSNAELIEEIQDHDLRKQFITTYSMARDLLDSFRMINELFRKHEQVYWMFKKTESKFHEK